MNAPLTKTRPRGRPRGYDATEALDAAMRVFWAEGYAAASIDTLCLKTGLSRASLYREFQDKENLFLSAVGHYVETRVATVHAALGPSGPLDADLAAFFAEIVALATRDPETPGCLVTCALADAAGANTTFRDLLDLRFRTIENKIERRLAADPERCASDDLRALAGMIAAVARGITLSARSGAPACTLNAVARVAVGTVIRQPG
ncbi:TetR/AcrR family transcriptional regulator [Anianabacter salinae]|uniref:TetR/AcrR family transcriptional regulator n=1 Tax=Anianabacter salinae TaxID=2851023 RepID=UPI00225E0F21|nr:TetR/AcrR family transcriptional regulator [Anianabacter salinae]MBV0910970.1 TetR/AcrR family transcriptional regulator [Anianabacter salinae]